MNSTLQRHKATAAAAASGGGSARVRRRAAVLAPGPSLTVPHDGTPSLFSLLPAFFASTEKTLRTNTYGRVCVRVRLCTFVYTYVCV